MKVKSIRRHLPIIFFVLLCSIIAIWFINNRDYRESDFFIYWLSSRLLSSGLDPYSSDHWVSANLIFGTTTRIENALTYPLPLAILFLPLGVIPLEYASGIWIFASTILTYTSIYILIKQSNLNKSIFFLIPVFLGVSLFRPFVTTIFTGQLAGLLLFVISISAYLLFYGKWNIGVVILPILLLKPQIGIPFLTLVTLWLIKRKKWRPIIYEVIAGITLVGFSFLFDVHWLEKWVGAGKTALEIVIGQSPTIWGASYHFCNGMIYCWLPLALSIIVLVIGLVVIVILHHSNYDPLFMFSLFTCTTLLTTPYLLASDQLLLLLPIVYAIIMISTLKIPRLYLATSTPILLISITSYLVILFSRKYSTDAFSIVVTIFVVFILCVNNIILQNSIKTTSSNQDNSLLGLDK